MLSKEEIKHVADLARLEFSDEQLDKFTNQMDDIIKMADSLAEVDTTNVEPTMQVVFEDTKFRPDEVVQSTNREELFKNVPETKDGLIKVPAILDKEED